MTRRELFKVSVLISVMLFSDIAQGGYLAKEKRWAEQILSTLIIGDGVWLKAKDQTFFAIYTKTTNSKPQGAVLLLHDVGLHPDWPEVIFPLRTQLPEQGWSTLSLQTPILPDGAPLTAYGQLLDDAPLRIRAGIEFLREQGINNIVLLGHGIGATLGATYLALSEHNPLIKGFIGIALDAPVTQSAIYKLDPRLYTPNLLEKLQLPIFDIYGGLDQESITSSASLRTAAARQAANPDYWQERFPDADHFFFGQDKALVKRVAQWLNNDLGKP